MTESGTDGAEAFTGGTKGGVRTLLRLEGAALLGAALLLYGEAHAPWQRFLIFFLAPDLSFAFYLFGARAGALAYNSVHSTLGAIGLFVLASAGPIEPALRATLLSFALIWLAHIGFDRMLGYGLKYSRGFSFTHLGAIGKAARRHIA
jgi:hypothetical protein